MKVVNIKSSENVCCPFCDKVVLKNDGESMPEECPHTLLIATDEGVEFHTETLDIKSLKELAEEENWDDAISGIDYPKAILIKSYDPAPSFFGAYYLFQE